MIDGESGEIMRDIRLIARLDIKDQYVVKGIQLEGLRKIGNPNELALKYYNSGIDEMIYLDTVASLYDRNNLSEIVKSTTRDIFIPICVGGGLRSVEDVKNVLSIGADKVAINTGAIKRLELIREIADTFGTQCMVVSVQAKKKRENEWEAYYDNGREHSGRDVIQWIKEAVKNGAGEIFLTSVDKDGRMNGMDIDLIQKVCDCVAVPVIVSGGAAGIDDIYEAAKAGASGVAIASILHYGRYTILEIKEELARRGVDVRL